MKRPWRLNIKTRETSGMPLRFLAWARRQMMVPFTHRVKTGGGGEHQVGLGSMVTYALTCQVWNLWIKNEDQQLEDLLDFFFFFLSVRGLCAYFKALATKHGPYLRRKSFFPTSEWSPAPLCHPKIKGFDRLMPIAASLSRPWASQQYLPWGSLRAPPINKGKPKTHSMAGTSWWPLLTFRCLRNNWGQESDRLGREGQGELLSFGEYK